MRDQMSGNRRCHEGVAFVTIIARAVADDDADSLRVDIVNSK